MLVSKIIVACTKIQNLYKLTVFGNETTIVLLLRKMWHVKAVVPC